MFRRLRRDAPVHWNEGREGAGFWVGLPITGIGKAGIEPFVNHGLQAIALVAGYAIARTRMRPNA